MKLSDMKQILGTEGIQLTKSLGQNFLHDANQLRRIIATAEVDGRDKVMEIGPGLGPLTELLLGQAAEVLAIEKDARLVKILRRRFPGALEAAGAGRPPVLRLLHADALEFLKQENRDWSDWKLVSNLPYSVASSLLVELAQARLGPQRMAATLQLEVARRLMAQASDEDYGVLTLLVQLNYSPAAWFKIPATCFFPQPSVDSACVSLVRRPQPLLPPDQKEVFVRIVKRSFSQRRKMMFKLLKQDWPLERLTLAFARLDLPLGIQTRAETVALEHFVQLTKILCGDS
jgi:16S rRNA (adenine1518-N6/adenine1519-N6)-dimethyltransferase